MWGKGDWVATALIDLSIYLWDKLVQLQIACEAHKIISEYCIRDSYLILDRGKLKVHTVIPITTYIIFVFERLIWLV